MIQIKNKEEIEKIRLSCKKLGEVLSLLKDNIQEGISTLDLDKIAYQKIKSMGATPAFLNYGGFPNSICASVNEAVIHGIPNSTPLKNGDIVGIDCGLIIDGYYSDMAYTFSIGEPSQEIQNLLTCTKEALFLGIEQVKPNNRIRDISKAIQERCKGYGIVRDYTGHGVGLDLHEDPQIPNFVKTGASPRIENGMIFAIEPMVNLKSHKIKVKKDEWTVVSADKSPSAHFEHTVLFYQDKAEILTKTDWF